MYSHWFPCQKTTSVDSMLYFDNEFKTKNAKIQLFTLNFGILSVKNLKHFMFNHIFSNLQGVQGSTLTNLITNNP